MGSRKSGLRTIDVARRAGYSVQQVRDLERHGVLPLATRTPAGYRRYTDRHVQAALAYRALAAGAGPVEAKRMLRAAYLAAKSELLDRIDGAHAALRTAADAIAPPPDLAATTAAFAAVLVERQPDDPFRNHLAHFTTQRCW